jgi:NADH-quinone oxidoreductase subunit E/NADP-reducing hydrogenase subunit HndA
MTNADGKLMREELISFIAEQKKKPGPLMPIMQKAQSIFGALTIDVQELIAEQLGIPMSDVYGVATFYSQFALEPKGEHIISVCMGTACYVRNIEKVMEQLSKELGVQPGQTTPDNRFTLEATRCLGCCGLAPVIMIDDQVYGRLVPSDVADILAKYGK